jgi:hypothetical protein
MKKIILTMAVVLTATYTNAQETSKETSNDSKGYIGVSIGAAFPGGDLGDAAETGLNLGFINAGYRFDKNWGLTLNWGGTAFSDKDVSSVKYGVGYLAIGPMVSFPLNNNIVLDLKPQYAFTSGIIDTGDSGYGKLTLDKSSGFILGSSVNFSLAKHWALSLNLDYLSTKFNEYDDGIIFLEEQDISTFNTSLGFQYKF